MALGSHMLPINPCLRFRSPLLSSSAGPRPSCVLLLGASCFVGLSLTGFFKLGSFPLCRYLFRVNQNVPPFFGSALFETIASRGAAGWKHGSGSPLVSLFQEPPKTGILNNKKRAILMFCLQPSGLAGPGWNRARATAPFEVFLRQP